MRIKKDTRIHLVEELLKLPQTNEIKLMIIEAKAGEYHDYKNQKYDCGKVESATRLDHLGHHELANRIKEGEFDEEADDDDRAMMKAILKNENMEHFAGFFKL